MAETYSAGIVTAYGAAVRGGYTGTYEQFCAEQAQFGANAAKVAQDRAAVEAATQTFTTVTVPGAVQTVQQTGATQVQAVEAASETEQQQIALAGAAQETRVTQAGDDQVDAVEEAGATQVGNVNTAGTTQVGNVNTAGTTQVGAVNTAGATQVQAVEDKGEEVLNSIPADYTDLDQEVDNLKSVLEQAIEDFAAPTQEAVDNWLDAHPEATTTVQDGSITKSKLTATLKKEIEDNTSDTSVLKSVVEDGGLPTKNKAFLTKYSLSLQKTDNRTGTLYLVNALPAGVYSFSLYLSNTVQTGTDIIGFQINMGATTVKEFGSYNIANGRITVAAQNVSTEFDRIYFYISSASGATAAATIDRIQIESGNVVTDYIDPIEPLADFITPETFGAVGDGSADDTDAINNCIAYAASKKLTALFRGNAVYAVTTVHIKDSFVSVDFNGTTLKGTSAATVLKVVPTAYDATRGNGYIKNVTIDMNNIATKGLEVTFTWRRLYESIVIFNPPVSGICVHVYGGSNCAGNMFSAIRMRARNDNVTGVLIEAADNTYSDIDYADCKIGIDCRNFSTIDNYHGYVTETSIYPNSVFLKASSALVLSNAYPDTQNYVFDVNTNDISIIISNLTLVFNTTAISDYSENPPYVFKNTSASHTKHFHISGMSINTGVYTDVTFTTCDVGNSCFSIDGFTCNGNGSNITIHRPGIEASSKSANTSFASALRSNYPVLYPERYVDKITASNNISIGATLAVWVSSSRFTPRVGKYSAVLYDSQSSEYTTVILTVSKYSTNQYVVYAPKAMTSGDILFVDIPVTDHMTTYYD